MISRTPRKCAACVMTSPMSGDVTFPVLCAQPPLADAGAQTISELLTGRLLWAMALLLVCAPGQNRPVFGRFLPNWPARFNSCAGRSFQFHGCWLSCAPGVRTRKSRNAGAAVCHSPLVVGAGGLAGGVVS